MTREKILQTAKILFALYGIKKVSMRQVANELFISERVLQLEFKDKEHLLLACINQDIQNLSLLIENIRLQSGSALKMTLFTSVTHLYYYSSFCPAFYRDLNSFMEVCRQWNEYRLKFRKKCIECLRKGEIEGDFLPNQNYELIMTMITDQFDGDRTIDREMMIESILLGICTKKGIQLLKRLVEWE